MSAAKGQNEESLGVILPDELVEQCGFKEGDVFEVKDTSDGFVLSPVDTSLQEQLRAAQLGMQKYRVALRDLAK